MALYKRNIQQGFKVTFYEEATEGLPSLFFVRSKILSFGNIKQIACN